MLGRRERNDYHLMSYLNKPIRQSQLVSPWGVGAMIDFPQGESLIVCGLDAWVYPSSDVQRAEFVITELGYNGALGFQNSDCHRISVKQNLALSIQSSPSQHFAFLSGTSANGAAAWRNFRSTVRNRGVLEGTLRKVPPAAQWLRLSGDSLFHLGSLPLAKKGI
ncbi:MAG: hypothetical protein UZ17_ACD001000408 [Acidobacteria bacterium OLB17]|nr:MAG: hypothetical protein UZ17_ACD001000408 [Acidobacteria bacterium OLB17]